MPVSSRSIPERLFFAVAPDVATGNQERVSLTTYIVPEGTRPGRADKILAGAFPDYSRVAFQRAIADGRVTRDGVVLDKSAEVHAGEELQFSFPDTKPAELRAVDIPLDILFEDEHMLAINKPAGMVVHPGAGTGEDTLVHALLFHCAGSLSGVGGVERPGIVHRLDRETSGVILVAKSDLAHRGLAEQFAERSMHKRYLALVEGKPTLMSGSIRQPIGRNPQQRHKMAIIDEEHGGRPSHTDWAQVEVFGGGLVTLMRCTLHTGRTHQIRVHMKSINHCLLGDRIYGWKPHPLYPIQPARVMLHAEYTEVTHPITGQELKITAPQPPDFIEMAAALRTLSNVSLAGRTGRGDRDSYRGKKV